MEDLRELYRRLLGEDWEEKIKKAEEELERLMRKERECLKRFERSLGIHLILDCDKDTIEKIINMLARTGSLYEVGTYRILIEQPKGETWWYRCSNSPPTIVVCKGDKYIKISCYNGWFAGFVGDASNCRQGGKDEKASRKGL